MTCTAADDAFLIAAWPGVVLRTGERWMVAVSTPLAANGAYLVTMQAVPFGYTATVPPDDAEVIRNALQASLGAQTLAAVAPQGLTGLLVQEIVQPGVTPSGLALTVSGPVENAITATLLSGGDSNATERATWLEQTLCWLPPCCEFGSCTGDYTVMHAAITAAMLYLTRPSNIGSTGGGANDFESMRLGPASLTRGGVKTWSTSSAPTDDILSRTVPGQVYLMLRARYVFPVMCR